MDREEGAGRIGDLHQPGVVHLEDADLVGRAEAVLGRPQQAHRGVPLALEADHRVDQVLERLGPGDRAVLGDVPDEDDGDPVALGQVHQAQRRLAHLADAAGRAVELVDGRRLDRIDDDERRSRSTGRPRRSDRRRARPGPGSALPRRRRAGRDASPAAGSGQAIPRPTRRARRCPRPWPRLSPAAAWSSSVDLPIPGSPPSSTREPGTRPPPSTRSSSPMPRLRRGRSVSAMCARPRGLGDGVGTAQPGARSATARGRSSRPGCSTRRTRGTGLPSEGTTPRSAGR